MRRSLVLLLAVTGLAGCVAVEGRPARETVVERPVVVERASPAVVIRP